MTPKRSVIILLSAFFISAMAISGCDTNSLTRRAAEKIINEQFHFPETIYLYLGEGEAGMRMEILSDNTDGELRSRVRLGSGVGILPVLDSLGYIDVHQSKILLTRQGKAVFQKVVRKDSEKKNWWRTPLIQYGIKEITGIALEGDNVTATVEYTLHLYDKTPIAVLIERYLELDDGEENSAVPMRKYDDGWRIEENRKRRR